ncbi:MAG: M56 family metallopeptidase [Clostridiales bacterium]|uniref:M56 family metallopeptidase n=1 Tax=Flavonifractor porci TaxID=3133422 RepID=UPI003094D7DC|nr:M56 family metallopeptidase [Clostridiales bacterium]
MSLLHMSFAGALMIVVITVIRAFLLYRVPKKTFMVLWGITLARLLLPFSIPSTFSVYTFFEKKPVVSSPGNGAVLTLGTALQEGQVAAAPHHMSNPDITVSVWAVIWAIGALICAVIFFMTYRKCCREFQTSLPVDNDFTRNWLSCHPCKRPIQIRQSQLVLAPLTFGVLRPVILMPKGTDWSDKRTLQYVLAHEFVHIRRFDAITKLILTAALCVHWFNPFVWVMYILSNRDMELSCDEAVVRLFGEDTKSSYARTLIAMEETKGGMVPLCNHFSKNALEERMTAIMKIKKSTVLSISLAVLIVAGTTTAFATSPKAEDRKANFTTLMAGIEKTYTKDGKTYHVLGDGSMMEESEYLKKYPVPEVEWWTYEEYKEWLENEKKELQSMLGETGRVNGEKFTWTQEKIDETIAMNEKILQEIKDGVKHSKTVDGQEDVLIAMNPGPIDTTAEVSMDINSTESDELTQKKMLDLYGNYGISFDKSGNMLFQGDLVRLFWDGVDVGDGASSVLCQYYNEKGTVDVHTVRSVIDNGDGSVDPFGKLIKIVKDSQEVFDRRDVDDYLFDGPSTTTASGFSNPNDGTSFAELMKKYAEFGIRYESGDGTGNIYYNNQLVKTFVDENKQGDVFTLSSEDGGEIVVYTIYDKNGTLTGVKIK